MFALAEKNAHPRDAHIQFEEEGHVYTIYGEKGTYVSTTTIVHHQFATFDSHAIIDGLIKRGRTEDPTNKYYGMTKEQILQQWADTAKEASGQGTKMHLDIELYSNGVPVENASKEFAQFLAFRHDFPHLTPYRTEWTVFYEEYKICGSIDMVYYNEETKSHEIYDWKRSKEIVFDDSYGKKSTTPGLEDMPDTNYWHYSLQLNVYKRILETKYDMKITGLYLICLHPDHDQYQRIEVRPMPKEIGIVLEDRLKHLS
jgi:hypothetical protein